MPGPFVVAKLSFPNSALFLVPPPESAGVCRIQFFWPDPADEAVSWLGAVPQEMYHSCPPVDGLEDRVEVAAGEFQSHCVPKSKSSYLYILILDMSPIISECCNLGIGLAMFCNDLSETMNAIMKRVYL